MHFTQPSHHHHHYTPQNEGVGVHFNGQWEIHHDIWNYACTPLHVAIRVELGSQSCQVLLIRMTSDA